VAYWTGTSAQAGSNNLFWDNSNNRLGIGTNTPAVKLDVVGNTTNLNTAQFGTIGLQSYAVNNAWFGDNVFFNGTNFVRRANGYASFFYFNQQEGQFRFGSNSTAGSNITEGGGGGLISFKCNLQGSVALGGSINFSPNDYGGAKMLISGTTGNTMLQNGGTFTDGGQRLQVQGTTLLNGNVTFSSATGMTWDATNSRLGIGTATPAEKLHITGNARFTGTFPYFELRPSAWSGYFYLQCGTDVTGSVAGSYTAFLNTETNRGYSWVQGVGAGSAKMVLTPTTFNLLLGSTTDSGERLQVTGNVRIVAGLNGLTVRYTASALEVATFTSSARSAALYLPNTIDSAWTNLIIRANSAQSANITEFQNSGGTVLSAFNKDGNLIIGSSSVNASAILQADSTTKGFLPPRMTTTQKNAITTPAAGLVVYDTTLAKLCVYTTAWETITSL
jgi:hypothetical protein